MKRLRMIHPFVRVIFSFTMGFFLALSLWPHIGLYTSTAIGSSMQDTIFSQDLMLLLSPTLKGIQRGDIVSTEIWIGDIKVIDRDKDRPIYYLKRVIGLPGETIVIDGEKVYIDGVPLDEPYAKYTEPSFNQLERTLKDDEYFLIGDNRMKSDDSRHYGPFKRSHIRGIVIYLHRPQSKRN